MLAFCGLVVCGSVATSEEPKQKLDGRKAKEFVRSYLKDAKLTSSEKPRYNVVKKFDSDDKVLYYKLGNRLRAGTESLSSVDNVVVDMLFVVEKLRVYPPEKVDKASWNDSLESCERVVMKLVTRYNEGGLGRKELDAAIEDTEMAFSDAVSDAIEKQAPLNGAKSVRTETLVGTTVVNISTDPAGGKVYIMSDYGWRQCQSLGNDPKEVIKTCAAGESVYGLEGKIWYWARWPDGSTVGPEKQTISGDTLTVKK
jgi:hypothetical protein